MKAEHEVLFLRVSAAINGLRVNNPRHDEGKAALAGLRAHIEELTGALAAGDERLIAAAGRAGVVYVGCDTTDALVEKIEELYADLIAETKSHAETAGFLQERKDQLARIRSLLSTALGVDGSAVELAKLAGKVIHILAKQLALDEQGCPADVLEIMGLFDECDIKTCKGDHPKCWARWAALDAAKGGSDAER